MKPEETGEAENSLRDETEPGADRTDGRKQVLGLGGAGRVNPLGGAAGAAWGVLKGVVVGVSRDLREGLR